MLREQQPLILVVDRDMDTRTSLYSILDEAGYPVATARPSIDALRYVSDHKPDLLIAGQGALAWGECNLIEKVREISPETRIILLYASGDTEPLPRGAHRLLPRSCSRIDLLETVGELLPMAHR